uniref:Tyrosine-protein kinase n=2 Tax=Meloidogyne TaxID=189290 RepID=A0A6V7U8P5_MELEN|nr:unnamed protein product [Meloidogyne enterolobii]
MNHSNLINLDPVDSQAQWFHKSLSREETEKRLRPCSNGTFLIRRSENYPGDFTLCVAHNYKVEHYRIYIVNGLFTCDKEELFESLTQLVAHYKRDADGLCHRLISPLLCESSKHVYEPKFFEERRAEFARAGVLLSINELRLGSVIGHGEFGDVLSGTYRGRKIAVKTLKDGMGYELLIEARFMIGLDHNKLVALIGVVMVEDTKEVFMLTEFMANGNLVDFLRSRGRQQVEREQLLHFAIDVAEGMAYIEARRFVHRDLAARNILLDDRLIAKISDFGLAQAAQEPAKDSAKGKFPIKWSAPEALRHNLFTNKSDVWSFGILLWEVYSFGRVPYPRIPIQDVLRLVEKGYKLEPPEGTPAFIVDLMRDCWLLSPTARPTFAEILNILTEECDIGGENGS